MSNSENSNIDPRVDVDVRRRELDEENRCRRLEEQDREMLRAYIEATGKTGAYIEDAEHAFAGLARNEAEFAESYAEQLGYNPENLLSWIVIDWEATWKSNLQHYFSIGKSGDAIWFFHGW